MQGSDSQVPPWTAVIPDSWFANKERSICRFPPTKANPTKKAMQRDIPRDDWELYQITRIFKPSFDDFNTARQKLIKTSSDSDLYSESEKGRGMRQKFPNRQFQHVSETEEDDSETTIHSDEDVDSFRPKESMFVNSQVVNNLQTQESISLLNDLPSNSYIKENWVPTSKRGNTSNHNCQPRKYRKISKSKNNPSKIPQKNLCKTSTQKPRNKQPVPTVIYPFQSNLSEIYRVPAQPFNDENKENNKNNERIYSEFDCSQIMEMEINDLDFSFTNENENKEERLDANVFASNERDSRVNNEGQANNKTKDQIGDNEGQANNKTKDQIGDNEGIFKLNPAPADEIRSDRELLVMCVTLLKCAVSELHYMRRGQTKTEEVLKDLVKDFDNLSMSVQTQVTIPANTSSVLLDEAFLSQFPICTIPRLTEFEDSIKKEAELKVKVKAVCDRQRGASLQILVNNIIESFISFEIGTQFSWCGLKNTTGFKEYNIAKLWKESVQEKKPDIAPSVINTCFVEWFRTANTKLKRVIAKMQKKATSNSVSFSIPTTSTSSNSVLPGFPVSNQ